jgi:beta-galactosidase/beta-glucuronidase
MIMAVATVEVDVTVEWDASELHNWQSTPGEGARDWLLAAQLFEEGVMVSSSVNTAGTAVFHFDGYRLEAVDQTHAWVPLPTLSTANKESDRVTTTFTVKLKANSPKHWSADEPYLYTLVLSLRDGFDGIVTQAESTRVGFRTVSIANGLLRVNGTPIIVRGVNRHEHHPIHGHTVDVQTMETDVKYV